LRACRRQLRLFFLRRTFCCSCTNSIFRALLLLLLPVHMCTHIMRNRLWGCLLVPKNSSLFILIYAWCYCNILNHSMYIQLLETLVVSTSYFPWQIKLFCNFFYHSPLTLFLLLCYISAHVQFILQFLVLSSFFCKYYFIYDRVIAVAAVECNKKNLEYCTFCRVAYYVFIQPRLSAYIKLCMYMSACT